MTYNLRSRKVETAPIKEPKSEPVKEPPKSSTTTDPEDEMKACIRLTFRLNLKPRIEEYNPELIQRRHQTLGEYIGLSPCLIEHELSIKGDTVFKPAEIIEEIKYFESVGTESDEIRSRFCKTVKELMNIVHTPNLGRLIAFIAVMHLCFDTAYGKQLLKTKNLYCRSTIIALSNAIHDTKDSNCTMRQCIHEKSIDWIAEVGKCYTK